MNGLTEFADCINRCQTDYTHCQNVCGERLEPTKEVVRIQYQWQFWATTDLWETMDGNITSGGIIVFTDSEFSNIPTKKITFFSPINPIPLGGISYCYNLSTWVTYDDGSCCIFRDFGCVNRG
jgi:hypothetical protein